MSAITNFQELIDSGALSCPPHMKKKEYRVGPEAKNLLLEVRKSASTWVYQLKRSDTHTNTYRRLGSVNDLSCAQAAKVGKQVLAEYLSSQNTHIATATVAEPTMMTWDTFIKDHFAPHCTAHIRSAKKYDQLQRLYVSPRFGHLPLSQITRKGAQGMHVDMLEKMKLSPASADHAIKFMRRALNLAVQWDYLAKNPLKNFELFMVDNQVENYLSDEQMQKLLTVLRTDSNRNVCNMLMLLLSTGARLNEVLSATWKNVSMEGRALKVDAIRSKSKRSRSIPLNDSAMWVLEQLDSRGRSEYLFPSPVFAKDAMDSPYTNITRAWYRLQKLAGIKIRVHDLRHGFASMLVSGGRSLYEVQQILGHSDPKVTMRYAHLSSKVLQEAANAGSVIVPRVETKAA